MTITLGSMIIYLLAEKPLDLNGFLKSNII